MQHTLKGWFHLSLRAFPKNCTYREKWVSEMYLRKVDGPRAVTLPDGRVLTRADLPDKSTSRWVASRKEVLVSAVSAGLISRAQALEDYAVSEEEFSSWEMALKRHGQGALKATAVQKYRQL